MVVTKGAPIHGAFSSSDASGLTEAAAQVTLYPAAGSTSFALGSTDYCRVTDLLIANSSTATLTVTVYDGDDTVSSAGELLAVTRLATNTSQSIYFATPYECQAGTYPHVKASAAGQVDVTLKGTVSSIK